MTLAVAFECLIAALVLFGAGREILRRVPKTTSRRIGFALFAMVGLYGAVAFFAQGLGSVGGLWFLPSSIEWPVGEPAQVLVHPRGYLIVTLIPCGRVQVYTAGGKFICGWFVEASGGHFTVRLTGTGQIEVAVARTGKQVSYSIDGDRLGPVASDGTLESVVPDDSRRTFPYPWPLWPLSHPFAAWGTGVVGMLGAAVFAQRAGRRTTG